MTIFNKILSLVLAAAAAVTVTAPAAANHAFAEMSLKGDVSHDGVIDAMDASLILTDYAFRASGKSSIFSLSQTYAGDVNMDGSVDAIDASMVLGFYAYSSTVENADPNEYYKNPTYIPEPEIPDDPAHVVEITEGRTYIDGILIVNKTYSLPPDYNPGLDVETEAAFNRLKADAQAAGLNIWLASGFRSYQLQTKIYNNNCYWHGREKADTFSARPGFSEHQSGLAIDVNTIDDSFAGTPEAVWLAENSWKYGFIIRYPLGKESITGYKYEPWHIRFVGTENAEKIFSSGLTLEEYFGITSQYG